MLQVLINQKVYLADKITTHDDHDKYITTQKFNKLTSEDSTARLAKAHLASKNDRSWW